MKDKFEKKKKRHIKITTTTKSAGDILFWNGCDRCIVYIHILVATFSEMKQAISDFDFYFTGT